MKLASPEALLALSVGVALVPLLVSIGTCYLKFSIVLSILRSGFGTQQAPSASMIMALSLVMSLVVMQPVIGGTVEKIKEVDQWVNQFRKIWETRFNQLDDVLSTLKKG